MRCPPLSTDLVKWYSTLSKIIVSRLLHKKEKWPLEFVRMESLFVKGFNRPVIHHILPQKQKQKIVRDKFLLIVCQRDS